ncbi:kinase-like domain-containing protein [Rhizophagus diaphanus]|nr:kinase-like domain-containing protein [Rhizophagus diaphanus] [Rhizophagus sp. MUCL 43196]
MKFKFKKLKFKNFIPKKFKKVKKIPNDNTKSSQENRISEGYIGQCIECTYSESYEELCQSCQVKYFRENSINWTTEERDDFIQRMQLKPKGRCIQCSYYENDRELCQPCQINYLKENFKNWTSGDKKIDDFIQKVQINEPGFIIFEWIPYDQFYDIKEIGKGGFATVCSAMWKDGPLRYDYKNKKWKRSVDDKIALKFLHNSKDLSNKFMTNEFQNEIIVYSNKYSSNIIKKYGISQNPDTKDYIMVLQYASGGNVNNYMIKNREFFNWKNIVRTLIDINDALKEIHEKRLVHRDLHTGNILINDITSHISDMGLCGEANNTDQTKIYGVMPYIAPEVLEGKPYTKAADIYSFGMIMYFLVTRRQPFGNCAHDRDLALSIICGKRPEIDELEAPKCYINLMKKCWDADPINRPNPIEISELLELFRKSTRFISGIEESDYEMKKEFEKVEEYRKAIITGDNEIKMQLEKDDEYRNAIILFEGMDQNYNYETKKEFDEAEEYRKANLSSVKNNPSTTHPQAIYTSRLLNSYTKDIPKYDVKFSDSSAIAQFLQHELNESN